MTTQSAPGHSSRPTHRPQQSFLGRFGRAANIRKDDFSPSSEEGGYVYVEDPVPVNTDKDLPAPPRAQPQRDYFEEAASPGGLGRKTSLMKKMKGVVKGGK